MSAISVPAYWLEPPPLARRLRRLRQEAGLRVADLAAKAGISAWLLYKVEDGQRQPSLATIQRLAKALGKRILILPTDGVSDVAAE